MVLAGLVAADDEDHRQCADEQPSSSRAVCSGSASGTSAGSRTGSTRGPSNPVPASIWVHPLYSLPAATEIGATIARIPGGREVPGEPRHEPEVAGLRRRDGDQVVPDHVECGGRASRHRLRTRSARVTSAASSGRTYVERHGTTRVSTSGGSTAGPP